MKYDVTITVRTHLTENVSKKYIFIRFHENLGELIDADRISLEYKKVGEELRLYFIPSSKGLSFSSRQQIQTESDQNIIFLAKYAGGYDLKCDTTNTDTKFRDRYYINLADKCGEVTVKQRKFAPRMKGRANASLGHGKSDIDTVNEVTSDKTSLKEWLIDKLIASAKDSNTERSKVLAELLSEA